MNARQNGCPIPLLIPIRPLIRRPIRPLIHRPIRHLIHRAILMILILMEMVLVVFV